MFLRTCLHFVFKESKLLTQVISTVDKKIFKVSNLMRLKVNHTATEAHERMECTKISHLKNLIPLAGLTLVLMRNI